MQRVAHLVQDIRNTTAVLHTLLKIGELNIAQILCSKTERRYNCSTQNCLCMLRSELNVSYVEFVKYQCVTCGIYFCNLSSSFVYFEVSDKPLVTFEWDLRLY